jgi:zinc protease
MKRAVLTAIALTTLLANPILAQQAGSSGGVKLPEYREIKLPNGALILLAERHDVPLIAFHARLRGGALADPPGKEGVAALTAELLKKGAGKRNAQQFAEAIDSVGGDLDAFPAREATLAVGEFLARDQELMIELLSDMLFRPTFPPDEFEKVRERSIEAIAAAKDSDPRTLIGTYYHAFLFGDHPYARPVGGTEASLAAIQRDDVVRYWKNHFGADRLILAMVGDFKTNEMAARLRRSFAGWGKAPVPAPQASAKKPLAGRRVLLVDKPDATQTYFWIGNVGIARIDPDRVTVDLANTIFGGRFTSLLNTELRVKSGLTYGAQSALTRESFPGAVAIASYTQTATTEQAVDMALNVLTGYREKGADAEAVASVKSYLLGQFPPQLETANQIAARLTELAFYGLDRGDVDQYARRVSAATREDLKRLITRVYPASDDLTFVFIGNAAAIRDVVKKYGPVTEMKITETRFAPAAATR